MNIENTTTTGSNSQTKNIDIENIDNISRSTDSKSMVGLPLQNMVRELLNSIPLNDDGSSNVNDEVMENTPKRFLKGFQELTSGYLVNVPELLQSAMFDSEGYDDIVMVDDIDFTSLCEHHLLPFQGKVTIAYIAGDKILGLSKFARLVEAYARRISLQERLTKEIATALDTQLKPKGVCVIVNSEHSCMSIRGVRSKDSTTRTIFTTGVFKTDKTVLDRLFALRTSSK